MRIAVVVAALLPALAAGQDKKPDPKAAPVILYASPLFPEPGAKTKLVLRGQRLDAVKGVTASDPAVKVKLVAARKANVPNNHPKDREGDSEIEIELELPKDLKSGLTFTAGDSVPYPLPPASDLPRVAEKEDNDGFRKPQPIPVPAAVVGTIKSDRDVDVFRFDGKKGTVLRVAVEAARFGSPCDPVLTAYDAAGRVLASADDSDGIADPAFTLTLPTDGAYFLAVLDAHDLGGGTYGYRLTVRPAK